MSQNTIPEIVKPFTPINNLAKWVTWLFIVLMILSVVGVISGIAQAELINKAISGKVITQSEATANDDRQALIGFFQIAITIVVGITFLVWVHRAHKNLPSLHAAGLRFTPGWAVGWFFVPIMSLVRPYQAVSEIWRASNPETGLTAIDTTSWKDLSTAGIVGWWWAFFLISNFIGQIALRLALQGDSLSQLLASTQASIATDVMDFFGIMITIAMVIKISQLQEAKHRLIISV